MPEESDRYAIGPLDGPAQFKDHLRGIERRLRELEGARPLTSTTITDDQGNVVGRIGRLPNDGSRPPDTWGIVLLSATGSVRKRFEIGTEGWILPRINYILTDTAAVKNVTSGSFVETWRNYVPALEGRGVEVLIPWVTGAGTTGELRIDSNIPSNTVAYPLPAASSGVAFARWLHGGVLGSGPVVFSVMARRTAGANNVSIFESPAYGQNPVVCDADGNWTP